VPYNMWYLTPASEAVSYRDLIDFVAELGEGQRAALVSGAPEDWRVITVTFDDGSWSFDLERETVAAGKPGLDELEFFRAGLDQTEPAVNARWVAEYLTRVQTVYTFRCSINAPDANLELVREIVDSFRNDEPSGLLYAELEGWSNEYGHHITWEFTEGAKGKWWMGLRREKGWDYFQMELGNRKHREAFRAGRAPAGVEVRTCSD
jgi:hypothetical protein